MVSVVGDIAFLCKLSSCREKSLKRRFEELQQELKWNQDEIVELHQKLKLDLQTEIGELKKEIAKKYRLYNCKCAWYKYLS